MPERDPSRTALGATIAVLVAAAVALGGSAALGWAQIEVQAPLRGIVQLRLSGSMLLSALGPLAVLALATVAAVLASGGWARRMLGVLLLGTAVPPALAVLRVRDGGWLTGAALSAADRPARSVPVGTATALLAGPGLAGVGAVLLAAAGVALVVGGHRMPRLGRRYQAPATRRDRPLPAQGRFWERLDAGEDPTAPGHPR
ncbi:MAG: Trp biosynthesis-associated membrane protein [Pseudonocardiaceae bacterium]